MRSGSGQRSALGLGEKAHLDGALDGAEVRDREGPGELQVLQAEAQEHGLEVLVRQPVHLSGHGTRRASSSVFMPCAVV